jgi:hypothetical protein
MSAEMPTRGVLANTLSPIDTSSFYVIAVLSNPERYKKRVTLFREFMARMERYKANLLVVELAYGDREYEVTDESNPFHIRIRSDTSLWHKENLINIGITRLPSNWKYVAWVDADIDFVRPDWIEETVHELQHHPVVQMFEDAIDMGPDHQVLTTSKSFAYCYRKNLTYNGKNATTSAKQEVPSGYYYSYPSHGKGLYWHPGYAWAATKDAINTLGGLFDLGIAGAGDHHMACCLIGKGAASVPSSVTKEYKRQVLHWEERAARLHKNIGYVKGTIYHFWHGKKRDRHYKDRWQILTENKYDPVKHIHKDWQGLLTLYPGHEDLRDDMRDYFQSRNEDSIDLE